MTLGRTILLLIMLGSPCTEARAQSSDAQPAPDPQTSLIDLELENLLKVKVDTVFAASKFLQEIIQAPASVSIVTADEIHRHGYRTLADVLRSVRGMYVSNDRNYSYIGLRGFSRPGDYNTRVLVLINGHRLNDTIYEQAPIGAESPIDISLVDRVEVIRGPSSSLYGTSAFFAVVNIITRSGRSFNGVEIEGTGGTQALRDGRFTIGGRASSGVEGMVSVSAFSTDGNTRLYFPELDAHGQSDGVARHVDADRATRIFATASAHGVQLQSGYASRRKHIPTASFGTVFNDPRAATLDERGFLAALVTRQLPARTVLQVRAAYDHYVYTGDYPYETGLTEDASHGAWFSAETTATRRFDRHALTAGFEYRDNIRQNQSATDETGVILDDHRHSKTAALYVEDEFRLTRQLIVNAGLRWDRYFDTFGATMNPRVGLIFSPAPGAALKLLYGRAFRAPNPFELYYDQTALSSALGPEKIVTHEIVWEQRIDPRLQITASVFHNRVTDLISQRSGSGTVDDLYFANGGAFRARGIEFEANAELPGRLRARLSHAVNSAREIAGGGRLSNSPEHVSTLVLDAPIDRLGLLLAFDTYHLGARQTVHGGTAKAAAVSNVTVSRQLSAIDIALSVRNLFDADYGDPGSEEHLQQVIPQDGRTASIRATWRF